MIEPKSKVNLLLRYADKILYFYAAVVICDALWGYINTWMMFQNSFNISFFRQFRLMILLYLLSLPGVLAIVFILTAGGYIAGRVIDVIEKSRSEAMPVEKRNTEFA